MFRNDALAGDGSVAVNNYRQDRFAVPVFTAELTRLD